jgi:hypothetical protein
MAMFSDANLSARFHREPELTAKAILDLPIEFEFSSAANGAKVGSHDLAPRLKCPPRRPNGVVVGFSPYPFSHLGITPRETLITGARAKSAKLPRRGPRLFLGSVRSPLASFAATQL